MRTKAKNLSSVNMKRRTKANKFHVCFKSLLSQIWLSVFVKNASFNMFSPILNFAPEMCYDMNFLIGIYMCLEAPSTVESCFII